MSRLAAAAAGGGSGGVVGPPPLIDIRADSLNTLRMKAREHEMKLEMMKKAAEN